MHRADPYSGRSSPRRRDRRNTPPYGDPASRLLQPWADPPRAEPLRAGRVRVTVRPLPARRPLLRGYRIHPLDVITFVLGVAVLVAVFWPGGPR